MQIGKWLQEWELLTMIESVVALLMFVNAEIKEARLQTEGMAQCLRGKRHAERQFR